MVHVWNVSEVDLRLEKDHIRVRYTCMCADSVTVLTISQSWVLLLTRRVPCVWEYAWLATEMVSDDTMCSYDHHRGLYLRRRDVRDCQSHH